MKKKLTLIALFILIWTTGLQAQNALQDADAKYETGLLKKGTKAPDFKLKTPDGKTVQLSKVAKGKYTVLDFWASWCPDCLKDIPNMQRMYKKFAPKGVEFVGISFDTNVDSWKKALDKFNISYTQVSDTLFYGPEAYAVSKYTKSDTQDALKELVAAMMDYCAKAKAFFGSQNG